MKTKKGEKEKLRLVILAKAIAYLKKYGRVGSGTDGMMAFVGLSRGALYSHFKSKDELFAQAICFDLKNLEDSLAQKFAEQGPQALRKIIEDHLSERSLTDVANSCCITSLSTDMQRSKAAHRGLYEEIMERIFALFDKALSEAFPTDSPLLIREKTENLYSGLVGTLTMARTMKNQNRAREILSAGRKSYLAQFTPS